MDPRPYLSTSLPSILLMISFFILTLVLLLPPTYCIDDDHFVNCARPYDCGSLRNIPYPFWGDDRPDYCGREGYKLECVINEYPVMQFQELKFRVLNFNQNRMTIARTDLWENLCPEKRLTTTLNHTLYAYYSTVQNITLFYGCSDQQDAIPVSNKFNCSPGDWNNAYFADDALPPGIDVSELSRSCNYNMKVPVFKKSAFIHEGPLGGAEPLLLLILNEGFEVEYDRSLLVACGGCENSGGRCGSTSTSEFVCFCPEGVQTLACSNISKGNVGDILKMIMIIAFVSLSVAIGVLIIGVYFKGHFTSINIIHFFKKESLTQKSVETFLRNNGPFSTRRYSYSDIKKMTNFFRHKLGQGGYGCVYKGKLQDGSFVAVKVLKESKGDGEEFINEVTSISRTSHVNIVTLRGFCFESSKRALIYEFMPNGSLEKFIYQKAPQKVDHQLGWETLHMIAIGIARGLEYLHRGCNARILHFDIKPHNILLDANFCPKISDFGLAKICPTENSIISMLGARGTVGYIAPEIFCRNFGRVSHKSDVYSYGMMILEMVGGKNNIHVKTDHTSETFFPDWIYKHLELEKELWMQGIINEEDEQNVKKMIIVGLWCIQTHPSNRPTMSRVVDMLEGSLNSLQIPPKPFWSSPSLPLVDSSTIVILHSNSIIPENTSP